MTISISLPTIICYLIHFTLNLLISISAYTQERKDEEIPKLLGQTNSISHLKGWARNDIGKWYEFNTAFNSIETRNQILKIDLVKIGYEGKQYLCVAGFAKSFYVRANVKYIEYSAAFWLIDTTKLHNLTESDPTVHKRIFQSIIVSSVVGGYLKPVTWNDILIQMKKCFIRTYPNEVDSSNFETRKILNRLYQKTNPPGLDESYDLYKNFFIKYRYDNSQNKVQFIIGTLEDDPFSEIRELNGNSYSEFDFTNGFLFIDCYDKERNRNLGCRYFEAPKNEFERLFLRLIR